MKRKTMTRAAIAAALGLLLAGCDDRPAETGRAGFKANYLVARVALENGQFEKASRSYRALVRTGGPLEPRLRLEYAHALLRTGKYDKAADEARVVAAGLTGPGRSAALAVQGTAEHEQARAAIRAGKTGKNQLDLLRSAQIALQEMLALNPEMDPTGGMKNRVDQIGLEIRSLL